MSADTPSPARDAYPLLAAHPPLMRSDERLLMGREAEEALDEIDRLRVEVSELRDATLVVECSEHDRSTVERLEADRDAAWGETQRLSTDLAELRALARMWETEAVRWRERAERAEQDADRLANAARDVITGWAIDRYSEIGATVAWHEDEERLAHALHAHMEGIRLRSVSDTPQNSTDRGGTLKSGPQNSSQAAPSEDVKAAAVKVLTEDAPIVAGRRTMWLAEAERAVEALAAAGLLRGDTRG